MTQKDFKNIPFFFIIGRPRSGTTLLQSLFNAHPNIIVPIEFPIILEYYYKSRDKIKWTREDLEEFYKDIFRIKFLSQNRELSYDQINPVDKEQLLDDLLKCEGETSLPSLIKALYLNTRSGYPKKEILLLGDKNPIYSMYVKELIKVFPEAKFVHIIRDYRDHTLSVLKTNLYSSPSIALIVYQWKRSIRMIERQKKKYPEKFFTLRYEDLVTDPEPQLEKTFSFLKVPFNKDILEFHKKTNEVYSDFILSDELKKFQGNIFNPINTTALEKWKKEFDRKSNMVADTTVGRIAQKYGYSRTFTSRLNRYLLPISIMKVYVQFQYLLRFIINPIPVPIRNKIQNRKPIFISVFHFFFKNV